MEPVDELLEDFVWDLISDQITETRELNRARLFPRPALADGPVVAAGVLAVAASRGNKFQREVRRWVALCLGRALRARAGIEGKADEDCILYVWVWVWV